MGRLKVQIQSNVIAGIIQGTLPKEVTGLMSPSSVQYIRVYKDHIELTIEGPNIPTTEEEQVWVIRKPAAASGTDQTESSLRA